MIRLQFSTERDLGSATIRWFGHGAGFSHVDTILGDSSLLGARDDVCQAVPAGVQIRPPGYAPFARVFRVEVPTEAAIEAAYYRFVRGEIGKPYDMRSIMGFACGRDWRDPGHWFCSELVAAALEAAGFIGRRLATPANKIDPDDLLLVLSALAPIRL